jgi:ATP-binding cassette, subfamily B, multidrug efflux pump
LQRMSEKAKFDRHIFSRLFRLVKPYQAIFWISLITIILLALLGPIRPKLIMDMMNLFVVPNGKEASDFGLVAQWIVNLFTGNHSIQTQLLAWTILLIVLLLLEAIIMLISTYFSYLLGQLIIRDIRIDLFKHFNKFRISYFDRTPNGTVVTRMISDIEAIAEVFSTGLLTILGDLLKLVFIITLMLFESWQLALVVLLPIPLLIIATRLFARAMKNSFQKERVQVNKLNTFVQEHLSGMSIVQLFNRQDREYKNFESINKDHRQAHIDAVWAFSIFFPVVELLSSLSIAGLILWGMWQLDASEESIKGAASLMFGFIMWVQMLYRPIRQLADRFNVLQRGMVRAERVFEVLDQHENIDDSGHLKTLDTHQDIQFKDVWFSYKPDEWVLKGIDFTVVPGKSVALVGTTGAGKSTIINLLTRFYEFQKGEILIGNESIRNFELQALRKNIGIVQQDVFLFSDSIFNNVTLGDESITEAQVIEAAKKVGAHDFISQLPGGYQYNVGERGGALSVGQKQLISFIRAFVYNPKILILDEATASVDSESEALIQNATRELQKGRTSIVIAHRLSTIVNSDEILVIDNGVIKERGTHQELILKDGQYKRLYDLNFS